MASKGRYDHQGIAVRIPRSYVVQGPNIGEKKCQVMIVPLIRKRVVRIGLAHKLAGWVTVDKILSNFKGPHKPAGITEENIQSRLRGLLLMAVSNRYGYMVLATGNKSEYAVGYATLYGDMCGGFAAIKDVEPAEQARRDAFFRRDFEGYLARHPRFGTA